MADVASIMRVNNETAQQHASVLIAGRASLNNDVSQNGQKAFERTQAIVGTRLGKTYDVVV